MAGAPVSPRASPLRLDFRRRRAVLPLASVDVGYASKEELKGGKGSETAMLNAEQQQEQQRGRWVRLCEVG